MMKQKDKGTLPAAKAAPLQGGELLNSFPHWGGIQGGVPLSFFCFITIYSFLYFQDRPQYRIAALEDDKISKYNRHCEETKRSLVSRRGNL